MSDSDKIIKDWRSDIDSEKNLYEIIGKSWSFVGDPRDFKILAYFFAFVSVPMIFCALFFREVFAESENISEFVVFLSGMLSSYYVGILGFIIASFALIITLFDDETFRLLAKVKHSTDKVSEFKFLFFNFIYVLFVYGIGVFVSITTALLFHEHGPVRILDAIDPKIGSTAGAIVSLILGFGFIYSLFLLKSLVWNLYALIVVSTKVGRSKH